MSTAPAPIDREAMGRRIRELRIAKDMTQMELAVRCGFRGSSQSIVKHEKGKTIPAGDVLTFMAEALDTTERYIMRGDRDEKRATKRPKRRS